MSKRQTKPSKEFRDAVSCALTNNDFSKLNSLINNTDVVILEQIKVKQEKDVKQVTETKQTKKETNEIEEFPMCECVGGDGGYILGSVKETPTMEA